MPKAVLKDGIIYPLEPLPAEWTNGLELDVHEPTSGQSDAEASEDEMGIWLRDVEEAAAAIPVESDRPFEEAIRSVCEEAKQQAQRELGVAG